MSFFCEEERELAERLMAAIVAALASVTPFPLLEVVLPVDLGVVLVELDLASVDVLLDDELEVLAVLLEVGVVEDEADEVVLLEVLEEVLELVEGEVDLVEEVLDVGLLEVLDLELDDVLELLEVELLEELLEVGFLVVLVELLEELDFLELLEDFLELEELLLLFFLVELLEVSAVDTERERAREVKMAMIYFIILNKIRRQRGMSLRKEKNAGKKTSCTNRKVVPRFSYAQISL